MLPPTAPRAAQNLNSQTLSLRHAESDQQENSPKAATSPTTEYRTLLTSPLSPKHTNFTSVVVSPLTPTPSVNSHSNDEPSLTPTNQDLPQRKQFYKFRYKSDGNQEAYSKWDETKVLYGTQLYQIEFNEGIFFIITNETKETLSQLDGYLRLIHEADEIDALI